MIGMEKISNFLVPVMSIPDSKREDFLSYKQHLLRHKVTLSVKLSFWIILMAFQVLHLLAGPPEHSCKAIAESDHPAVHRQNDTPSSKGCIFTGIDEEDSKMIQNKVHSITALCIKRWDVEYLLNWVHGVKETTANRSVISLYFVYRTYLSALASQAIW